LYGTRKSDASRDAESLKAVTPNSIPSRDKLWNHLRKVQQEGVAYDFEENVPGGVCMGTAIRNHTGNVVAGMSISLPTQRLLGDILITLKEHLVWAASRLSSELGYPGDRGAAISPPVHNRRRSDRAPEPTAV
jgi:DNA-binding IclR family transcriptional regulator